MRLGAKIFGILSGVLILYLALGLLLPSTWEARSEAVLPGLPSEVFPFLNRMDRWVQWNAMPESGTNLFGPEAGVGSGIRWDDPQYGKGQLLIVVSVADSLVEYDVEIEGGALEVHGVLALRQEGMGTQISWVERGDFGWNPLMGYAARGMGTSQAEAMHWNLERLRALLDPADGSSPGSNDP